jgi:hypothetical protein
MQLLSWLGKRTIGLHQDRPNRKRRPAPRCRPRLEALEDRCLPANFGFGWASSLGSPLQEALPWVRTDPTGNVYLTGSFEGTIDFDPGPGITNLTSPAGWSVYAAKYSPSGGLLWAKAVTGTGLASGGGAAVDPATGDLLLSGYFEGTATFGAGETNQTTLTSSAGESAYAVEFDAATGDLVWAEAFGGPAGAYCGSGSLAADGSGNVYLTGSFTGSAAFGATTLTSRFHLSVLASGQSMTNGEKFQVNDGVHVVTFEMDNNGQVATGDIAVPFGQRDSTGTIAAAIAKAISSAHTAGLTLATSEYTGSTVFIEHAQTVTYTPLNPAAPAFSRPAQSASDFLAKLNAANGNVVWAQSDLHLLHVAANASGVYGFSQTSGFRVGHVNADGSGPTWTDQFQTSSVTPVDIALDPGGNVLIVGKFAGSVDFDPGSGTYTLTSLKSGSTYTDDTFILKLTPAGAFVWAKSCGGKTGADAADAVTTDAGGNVYAAGMFTGQAAFGSYTLTAQGSSKGTSDIFATKLDANGNVLWAADMGGNAADTTSDVGSGIAIGQGGAAVYVGGTFAGTGDFDPTSGAHTLTSAGSTDLFLVKLTQPAPQIGSFTASPNPVTTGSSLTLTASNLADANPGSIITQVAFYLDSNGDGILEPATDTLLGYATQTSPGVWTYTFTVNLSSGSYTLFAKAEDSYGVLGHPVMLTLTVS